MNKKAIYSIIGVIVAMIVLSVSLVFAIGPRVSADSNYQTFAVPEEYLNIEDEVLYGLTDDGWNWAYSYDWYYARFTIEVPDSVTEIAENAFYGFYGLGTITLPDGLTSIGSYAFYECDGLITIELPNSLTSIGSDAFNNCNSLTTIELPNSLTSLSDRVFQNCNNLTTVTLPDGLTSIGSYAFYNCDGLTTIELPDSLTSISEGVFQYCYNLTTVTLPDSLTSIGNSAFSDCNNLTTIELPNGLETIDSYAFAYCNKLTTSVPATVTTIGNNAFRNNWLVIVDSDEFIQNTSSNNKNLMRVKGTQYTVTFDVNGGTGSFANQEVTVGEIITWVEPSKEGTDFLGWYDLNNNQRYDATTAIKDDVTLTAKWGGIVTFDSNGGSKCNTQYIENGNRANQLWPGRDYHNFLGWYLGDEAYDFSTPVTHNITLVAHWEIYHYNVVFEDSLDGAMLGEQVVDYGAKIMMPETPTREGYRFAGWYEVFYRSFGRHDALMEKAVMPRSLEMPTTQMIDGYWKWDFETPVTGDITLTAMWEKLYTVTFFANGGNAVPKQQVTDTEKVTEPTVVREGYTFLGWYIDDDTRFDFNQTINENTTVVAKWQNDVTGQSESIGHLIENGTVKNNQNTKTVATVAGVSAAGIAICAVVATMIVVKKRRHK